jgi:hypothetical protein
VIPDAVGSAIVIRLLPNDPHILELDIGPKLVKKTGAIPECGAQGGGFGVYQCHITKARRRTRDNAWLVVLYKLESVTKVEIHLAAFERIYQAFPTS